MSVTCRASSAPEGDVSIKQMIPDDIARVRQFEFRTPGGAQMTVIEQRDAAVASAPHRFTERVVRGPGGDEVIYHYVVEPGAWMDDAVHDSLGRRFGRIDGRGGVLSGRSLFLLPSWYQSLETIVLTFHLPAGWQAVGTLPGSATEVVATGAGRAAAAVVDSVVGVGPFVATKSEHGKSILHVYASEDLPDDVRQKAFRLVREGFAYLDDRLGPLGHDYSVVLVAPPADGSMILVPPTAAGQGSEIVSVSPVQVSDLFFAMARSYTDFPGAPFILANQDAWLRQALPLYFAIRTEDALGVRPARQAWRLRAPSTRAFTSLADTTALDEEQRVDTLAKGSWILAVAEAQLKAGGRPPDDLDAFVRRLHEAGGRRGLFDLIEDLSLPVNRQEIQEIAMSDRPISRESVAKVSGIEPLALTGEPQSRTPTGRARRLRLLATSNTRGMLEVCGCKARQLGGIARRETVRVEVSKQPEPTVLVDLGNAYALSANDPMLSRVERDELSLALDLMHRQNYAVSAIGHSEMLRGPHFFEEMSTHRPLPYINANLKVGGRPLAPPWKITRAGPVRIGWISALDPHDYGSDHSRYYEENLDGLEVRDPFTALSDAARAVRRRSDLVVAIGSLSPDLVRRLVERVPEIDAILSTEAPRAVFDRTLAFPGDPENQVLGFHGRTLVFFGAGEGKYLEEIALTLAPEGMIAGATVVSHPLGEDVPDNPLFRERLTSFYGAMEKSPELAGEAGPVARVLPAQLQGSTYVGAVVCSPCHAEESAEWQRSPHGFAFSTLLLRHRNYAPGCVRCHVTGYGLPSGYHNGDPLERLRHVQCEMCHGPGSAHASAPTLFNIIRHPPREACFECHDPAHSEMTAENFSGYYERASHKHSDLAPHHQTP